MNNQNGSVTSPKLSQAVAALRHRNFRLFWFGQLISLIGTWMQNMALGWLVLQLTDSAFLLGVVSAMQFLPLLLLSLLAGAVADRLPKRRMLIFTQSGSLVLALILGLLVLFKVVRYWEVLVLATLLGIINAFDTPTRQSFVVELSGRKDLMNAIVLNSSAFNAARVVGPALAGLAIGRLGMATCFLINAGSFLAVIAGLLMIRLPENNRQQPEEKAIREQVLEGLAYIWRTSEILKLMVLLAILSIFAMNFNVLIPVLARNNLGQQAEGYGLLMSAMGFGAVGGSLILATLSHLGPRPQLLIAGASGLCAFQLLLAFNRSYRLALVLLALTGWAMISFVSTVNTTLQLKTPDNLRGRVMSVYSLLFLGMTPLGSVFSGSIAHLGGAPAGLAAGAVVGLLSLPVLWPGKHAPVKSPVNR